MNIKYVELMGTISDAFWDKISPSPDPRYRVRQAIAIILSPLGASFDTDLGNEHSYQFHEWLESFYYNPKRPEPFKQNFLAGLDIAIATDQTSRGYRLECLREEWISSSYKPERPKALTAEALGDDFSHN